MRKNAGTKVYLNLMARMRMLNNETEDTHTFYSGEFEIFPGTDFDAVIEKMKKNIFENFEKMETAVGSGWALVKIRNLKLHFAEFKTLEGSSYVELPDWIKNKKAVINILNTTDSQFFKWCITRAMNPIGKNQKLITKKLREQSKIFDWTGVNFPTSFEDISRFEKNLRNGNGRYKLAVTLLLFEEHYCLVRNVSRLVSRQICDGTNYFCDYCSFSNCIKSVVLKHQESCTGEVFKPERVFPTPGSFLKFKNCERSAEQPFVIYADFESRLKPMFVKKGEFTTQYQEHVPVGYAYYLVCRFDATQNIFRSYTARSDDEDIGLHFVKSLRDTALDLWMKFKYSRAISFTIEDMIDFREAKECWICGKNFSFMDKYEEKVVRDHCHYTGKYRGAAQASCNLRLRRSKKDPGHISQLYRVRQPLVRKVPRKDRRRNQRYREERRKTHLNVLPKTEYVAHIRNILKYEELGCRITKVHRALTFDEAPWMKTYVERNIEKRKQARNSFEKDFWKLANNSVFGKTCENVMNHVDVRLVNERKKALRQILKPNYKQHTIYNENLVGILMGLNKVKLNKPSYVGVAILDLSKILMYDFFYDFVQPTWGPRAEVLFTDTDSLALQVHTDDLYRDIEPHVEKWFDTSKLKTGNPQGLPAGKNSGIVGKFKDEEPNDIIIEFVGIRAKITLTQRSVEPRRRRTRGSRRRSSKRRSPLMISGTVSSAELSSTSPKTRFGPGSTRSSSSRFVRRRCARGTTNGLSSRTESTLYRLDTLGSHRRNAKRKQSHPNEVPELGS